MRMKNLSILVIFFVIFNVKLLAKQEYSCLQLESIEQFKQKSLVALQLAFSDIDAVIFNKIFQIQNIKEISHDKINKISKCVVSYKVVAMDRNEALGFLYAIGNDYSEFKNILTGLINDDREEREKFINRLKKFNEILPKSTYISKYSNKKIETKIGKFAIFELFRQQIQNN